MKITIQSPGFKADQRLLTFVTKKLEKLDHYNETIIESQVCLKIDKSGTVENKTCEIKLVVPGNDLFAAKNSKIFQDAVIKVVNALKSQLLELKITRKGVAAPN